MVRSVVMENDARPQNDAVNRFKKAFAIYTHPGVKELPAPAKKTIATVLTIVGQSKLVKVRPKRFTTEEHVKSKGWVVCLKFTGLFLLFLSPLVALQVAARTEFEVADWILLAGYMYSAAIGIGLFISSLIQGFRYFFLVFLLPFVALGILLCHPIVGAVLFLCTQIYALYYIFFRMRSLAFKAMVCAFIVATSVTGPLLMGNASFVGAVLEKSRSVLGDLLDTDLLNAPDEPENP